MLTLVSCNELIVYCMPNIFMRQQYVTFVFGGGGNGISYACTCDPLISYGHELEVNFEFFIIKFDYD